MASTSETVGRISNIEEELKGFLRVIDDHTLGFADVRGNKQYISVGNLNTMLAWHYSSCDYSALQRLKILGHATIQKETQRQRH